MAFLGGHDASILLIGSGSDDAAMVFEVAPAASASQPSASSHCCQLWPSLCRPHYAAVDHSCTLAYGHVMPSRPGCFNGPQGATRRLTTGQAHATVTRTRNHQHYYCDGAACMVACMCRDEYGCQMQCIDAVHRVPPSTQLQCSNDWPNPNRPAASLALTSSYSAQQQGMSLCRNLHVLLEIGGIILAPHAKRLKWLLSASWFRLISSPLRSASSDEWQRAVGRSWCVRDHAVCRFCLGLGARLQSL
jgi:hypothetical protein